MVMAMMMHDGGGAWFAGSNGAGFSASEAANVSAGRLTYAVSALRRAVDSAVQKDRNESTSWWNEFFSFLEHGPLGYKKDREEFEAKGEALIADCYSQLDLIEGIVADVQAEAGPVPGNLEADAAVWREKSEEVSEMRSRITQMRQIPGWVSGASNSYTARSTVQDGATQELQGMALSMANAINQVALFNRALFLVMDREIKATTEAVKNLQGGTGGHHFRRAANGVPTLNSLREEMIAIRYGAPVKDSASVLAEQVTECLRAPQLLQPGGWPSGGAQASTPPAATDSVPDPDESDSQVDAPTTPQKPGGGDPGVKR